MMCEIVRSGGTSAAAEGQGVRVSTEPRGYRLAPGWSLRPPNSQGPNPKPCFEGKGLVRRDLGAFIPHFSHSCTSTMPRKDGGRCIAVVEEDSDGEEQQCGVTTSTSWYGKRGFQFCASHRAAWNHWKADQSAAKEDDGEEPNYLTSMVDLVGTRFCEPSKMAKPARYNDIKKSALQFCVQGEFTCEGYARGETDTRWQSLQQLSESCSREAFTELTDGYIKELQKAFKQAAKRFKSTKSYSEVLHSRVMTTSLMWSGLLPPPAEGQHRASKNTTLAGRMTPHVIFADMYDPQSLTVTSQRPLKASGSAQAAL